MGDLPQRMQCLCRRIRVLVCARCLPKHRPRHDRSIINVRIIPAPEDRLAELFDLYEQYDRPADEPLPLDTAAQILAAIRRQGAEVFVVVDEAQLVGTYMIHICQNLTRTGQPFGIIENVICAASHRRRGVGRLMMDHAIGYAKETGCFKVALQTGATRTDNHAFYESCGFTREKQAYQIRLLGV